MEILTDILRRLHDAGVEFSLIGGLAARHYGVTLVTDDVDICARFTPENLRKIEKAVQGLHPRHRLVANPLPLQLTDELCTRLRNLYLTTDLGILDCLSEVAGVGDFDAVLRQSEIFQFPFGKVHILKLDALINAKQAVGRPNDLRAVSQLRAIEERSKDKSHGDSA